MKKIRWNWRVGGARGIALALLVAGIVGGCYPKAGPTPGPVSADDVARASRRWPGVTAESLASGHDLFIAHCNKCHGYPDLTAIDDKQWPAVLKKMAKKADLTPTQSDLVLHFVQTARYNQ